MRIAGRKDAPGRPFLYEPTRDFLIAFGLRDIAELPKVEGALVVGDVTGEAPLAEGNATAQTEASEEAAPASEGRAAAPDVVAGEIAAAEEDGAVGAEVTTESAELSSSRQSTARRSIVARTLRTEIADAGAEAAAKSADGDTELGEDRVASDDTTVGGDDAAGTEDVTGGGNDTVRAGNATDDTNAVERVEDTALTGDRAARDAEDQAQQAPRARGAHVETGR
ncbi:MAG: SMC-Scp complex subunit ScpB [Candidatus Rokubacteria bacterium]|nr:SMC-Scp complex subunit ScpB [Candidatus Rokubacteria bacterium]